MDAVDGRSTMKFKQERDVRTDLEARGGLCTVFGNNREGEGWRKAGDRAGSTQFVDG